MRCMDIQKAAGALFRQYIHKLVYQSTLVCVYTYVIKFPHQCNCEQHMSYSDRTMIEKRNLQRITYSETSLSRTLELMV